jgi:threonylcarbamoyladenosine tRNA methylthiotransferase MtaB
MGWEECEGVEEADLCVVNTCTVTDAADKESRQQVRQLKKKNPSAKIAVTGCSVDGDPEGYAGIVDILKRNHEKEELLTPLFPELEHTPFKIEGFEGHTRAFVKVQDGCNSFCTYCVIPYVRGRSRSRTIPEVVQEVEGLIGNGFQEVVLTGINIGDFEEGLSNLVREVDKIPGLKRLRISSIDPDEVDENLTSAILEGKTTCHSLHLVLQSGSNVVLKRMNRKYTRQIFLETCHRLRRVAPDFTFTTDVIVGFPGETEADHLETLSVIEEIGFAKVHMFPYSPRQRTRAALYPNQVPQDIKQRRKKEVLEKANEIAFLQREPYVGLKLEVLTEGHEGKGHTANFLPVEIENPFPPRNTLIAVQIVANTPTTLKGITLPK